MESSNESILSLILYRTSTFDSRQIFRDYFIRQINLLQWLSLIAITTLLLKHLLRLFDLRRRGNRVPVPPFQLFFGDFPKECDIAGKTSTGQKL